MSEEMKNVTLYDEEGNAVEFEVITQLEIEDNEYFIVVPANEDVEEAVALKVVMDGDDEILVPVEDENELMIVSEAYDMLYED